MHAQRVNILGASGSGASTVGRAVSAALDRPHFDVDDYYHELTDPPFQRQRSPHDRCELLTSDLNRHAGWVLSGGIAGWLPYPQIDVTLFVFLWVPAEIRLERLRSREHRRFGERVLPGGDMFAAHEEFIQWASRYDAGDVEGKTLARHEAYLAAQTCRVMRFHDGETTMEITAAILGSLGR